MHRRRADGARSGGSSNEDGWTSDEAGEGDGRCRTVEGAMQREKKKRKKMIGGLHRGRRRKEEKQEQSPKRAREKE